MMAVRQAKGEKFKVRPVFDYRAMNETVESYPSGATPLCAERMRQWRQLGPRCALLDLKRAYLQVFVNRSLWVHQAVRWNGGVFLLTRLGFGLSPAPKIMTAIVEKVIEVEPALKGGVSSYIDDLFVVEDLVTAGQVKEHLQRWGLQTKEPERLGVPAGVRVLGLRVDGKLKWGRDGHLPQVDAGGLSRRQVHRVLGEWVGHFPVAGWLRVASGFLQQCTAADGVGWDESVSADTMKKVREVAAMIEKQGDPAKGQWVVRHDAPVTVWTDASSIALGVAIEVDGDIVEDAAWLRPKTDTAHINRSELDAAIRGITLALRWGRRVLNLKTDSATVHGWLKAVFDRTHNFKVACPQRSFNPSKTRHAARNCPGGRAVCDS